MPPTKTSTLVGRLPAGGGMLSGAVIGPRPVPHNVIAWPFFAVTVGWLIGWLVELTKFCRIPGPDPVPSAVNMPTALFVIRTGDMLPRALLKTTWSDAMPSGALDGMMALICDAVTNRGMAATVVDP